MTQPGPRPMGPSLRTSVRILGKRADEFEALCHLLHRKPFQLAADMVLDGIRRHLADPKTEHAVRQLVAARAAERSVVAGRATKGGFRVLDGGA